MFYTILFLSMFIGISYEEDINPVRTEEHVFEGDVVTLSCKYTGSYGTSTLMWYQQHPGSKPEFLLLATEVMKESTQNRFSVRVNEEKTHVDLKISSVEVTDSALYYCALQPQQGGIKIIFGPGTKLTVASKDHSEPKYYNLNKENTNACLATEFSSHSATNKTGLPWREASRVKGDSYYSQVALINNNETCENGSPSKNGDNWPLKTDRKTNFLSLTILGLRILFLKTIIFNVLMTLRVWMS